MILVKRSVTELTAGFAILQAFQERLKSEWEPHCLRHYVEQQEAYRGAKQRYKARTWLGRLVTRKPVAPKRPLRFSHLLEQVYEPVWRQWLEAMRSTPEQEIPITNDMSGEEQFGRKGEQNMLFWLNDRLDDQYLGACRLQMNSSEKADADVFIIGPKGLWYFEVKTWKGHVRGIGNDNWLQTTKRGEQIKHPSPIWMWRRVAKEIGQILRPVWQDPLRQAHLMRLAGGVVFTLDASECELNISDGSEVKWGYLRPYWQTQLEQAPLSKGATPSLMIKILDTVLARHQHLYPNKPRESMAVVAEQLIELAEAKLKRQYKS